MAFDDQTIYRRIGQQDILAGAVKQRHIDGWIIFSGLAADLPDGSTEVKAYYATDINTLYLWNGTVWKSEIFT